MATAKSSRIDARVTEEIKSRFTSFASRYPGRANGEILELMLEICENSEPSVKVETTAQETDTAAKVISELDDSKTENFFSHMTAAYLKGREYLTDLSKSRYTLKSLVEDAIAVSGKLPQEFLEAALTAQAKMELSLKARRDSVTVDPRAIALTQALAQLNQEKAEGNFTGKVGLTAIADRAGKILGRESVNYNYVKQWAKDNATLLGRNEQDTEVEAA